MSGLLQFGIGSPLAKLDPMNKANQSPYSRPFGIPKLQLNPLNPPDTTEPKDVDTSPLFKSSLDSVANIASPDRARYREFLSTMPQRQDYQQNKWGKLLSGVAGTAEGYVSRDVGKGIKTGTELMDRPYEQALTDYSNKGGMLKELSGLEYQDAQDKRAFALEQDRGNLARRKQWFDELKGYKDMQKSDAEINNLVSQIENRGLSLERGTKTGELYVVDKAKGTKKSLGQFDETKAETRQAEYGFWEKRYGKEQAGRFALQDDAQAFAKDQQGRGFGHDKDMADYRAKLDNLKPEVQDKAWNAAYDKVLASYPELKTALFTEGTDKDGNPNGKLTLKPQSVGDGKSGTYNPAVYGQFIEAVNQEAKKTLGLPTFDLKEYNANREIDPQRQSAVERLQQYNTEHPGAQLEISDENIANMMGQQDAESREFGQNIRTGRTPLSQFDQPYVNAPDYAGQVNPMVGNLGFSYQNLGKRPELRPKKEPLGHEWWRTPRLGGGGAGY